MSDHQPAKQSSVANSIHWAITVSLATFMVYAISEIRRLHDRSTAQSQVSVIHANRINAMESYLQGAAGAQVHR